MSQLPTSFLRSGKLVRVVFLTSVTRIVVVLSQFPRIVVRMWGLNAFFLSLKPSVLKYTREGDKILLERVLIKVLNQKEKTFLLGKMLNGIVILIIILALL